MTDSQGKGGAQCQQGNKGVHAGAGIHYLECGIAQVNNIPFPRKHVCAANL